MAPKLTGVRIVDSDARCGTDASALLPVLLQPRASRDRVLGVHDDRLKVQVKAPPVEGKANAALVRFLAKRLGVARSNVEVAKGLSSRRKLVRVAGLRAAELIARLEALL